MINILLSVKPEYVCKILNKEKILEIRTTCPADWKKYLDGKTNIKPKPCKVYIYCTKCKDTKRYTDEVDIPLTTRKWMGNGRVVAEFTLNKVEQFSVGSLRSDDIEKLACLSYKEIINYFYKSGEADGRTAKLGYAWYIDNLIIYDKPKGLNDFRKPCISPEMPYCPDCKVGYESIPESEAEFYRAGESCRTEWCCLNFIKRPPQSWCYVEEKGE